MARIDPDKINMGEHYQRANSEFIGDPSKAFPNTRAAFSSALGDAQSLMRRREPLAAVGRTYQGGLQIVRGLAEDVAGSSRQIANTVASAPALPSRPAPRADDSGNVRALSGFQRVSSDASVNTPQPPNPAMQGGSADRQAAQPATNDPDVLRRQWRSDPSASRGLRGASDGVISTYNQEQAARNSGISARRQANGVLEFSNTPGVGTGDTGGNVSSVDMRGANESYARANAIRQSALDSAAGGRSGPGGGVIGSGREERDPYQSQIDDIMFRGANSRAKRAMLKELMDAQQGDRSRALKGRELDQRGDQFNAGREDAFALEQMRQQGSMNQERYRQEGMSALEQAKADREANDPVRQAQGKYYGAQAERLGERSALPRPAFDPKQTDGMMPEEVAQYQKGVAGAQQQYDKDNYVITKALSQGATPQQLLEDEKTAAAYLRVYGAPPVRGYADGGLVQAQQPMPLPEVNAYREYSEGARRLGLPAIPFEQFLSLQSTPMQSGAASNPMPQPMSAMGFAQGGEIPDVLMGQHMTGADVSGKMVVDTDPNAQTDSIPAMIDGAQPAALDSGEFVLPEDVVKFFGTERLNKMIAQARKGAQTEE